jgi:hypothetical protein
MVSCLARCKSFRRIIKALTVTVPFAAMAVDSAYKQRGYFAVGGEWIMTIMIFSLMLIGMERWNRRKHFKHNRNAMQKTSQR